MDKISLDVSNSACTAEQMIIQESHIDYKLGPVTELGLTLKSAHKCTQPEQKSESGAGANAGSREGMVYVTTDPLSELVWSPQKGLSLKCADCNLTDNNAFLWGMVLSSPPSITVGEKSDVEPSAGGSLNPSQMLQHLGRQVSDKATLMGSPGSTKSIVPIFQAIGQEHKLGEDLEDFSKKEEQVVQNLNHDHDHSDRKGKRLCGPTDLQSTETSRTRRKMIFSNPEKASELGVDNLGTADSSSRKRNEEKPYSVHINPESGNSEKETSSEPFEENMDFGGRNSNAAGMDCESAYKMFTTEQSRPPDNRHSTSVCNNHVGLASAIQEKTIKKITVASSHILLEKGDSTSENNFEPLRGESASAEVGTTSHVAHDVKQNECQNGVPPEYEVALVEASPDDRRPPPRLNKGKEKVLFDAEINAGILKDDDDDDSHESVESCNNSKGLILAGKRPWSSDQPLVIGNKKLKKQTHKSPDGPSVQMHGSSFMNWISNMVKGSSKSDLKEMTTLDLVMRPNHEHGSDDQHIMLQERNQQSGCTNMGFGTVFKALYHSGGTVPGTGISNTDYQLEEGSDQVDLVNQKGDSSSIPATCVEENAELCNKTVISTEKQVICGVGGGSLFLNHAPSAYNSVGEEDNKIITIKNKKLLNIPCDHVKGAQISSSSSIQNGLDIPAEDRECQLGFSAPKSVINRSHTFGSLWITRFYPKVPGHVMDSSEREKNANAAVEGLTDRMGILSAPQNCVVSVKDHNDCEHFQEPFIEDRSDVMNQKVQNCVVSTAGSFGSIRVKECNDQKFKSTINTIQTSQRFLNSEAMASVFARRLDALRHIMPSEVEAKTGHATTCIFCGIRGHRLQECSDITESELDALLKKIDAYDGVEESSCLCIRCFQLNHWAIACPNISSKRRSHSVGSSLLDFRNYKRQQTARSEKIANDEEISPLENMVSRRVAAHTVFDDKKPRMDTEFVADIDVNQKVSDEMILGKSYSDSKLPNKDLIEKRFCAGNSFKSASREFILDGKQTRTSNSTENVSKEYQITAFYNFVVRQIPPIPRGTFETIKRLRFSRTDIFKWRRSPVPLFPLEGFFIRLRLRKGEKDLGSTGYYVARINGGLREKSSASSKVLISVKIGGFKCLVESRFVSNHDFLEDELLAWWCATLKGGGSLPSEKDLEIKHRERKRFGI